jgi:hypothetical protein
MKGALPDPPFLSRSKFIYRNCATLPRIVIIVDDQPATNHAIGKVVQNTFCGIVPVCIHPKKGNWLRWQLGQRFFKLQTEQVTIRNHQAIFLSPQQAKALWNVLG